MRPHSVLVALTLPIVAGCSFNAAPQRALPPANADFYASGSRAKKIYLTYYAPGKNEIRSYEATADGNDEPTIQIAGAKTHLAEPYAVFAAPQGPLWACNAHFPNGSFLKFRGAAQGNVAPLARIGGSNNPVKACGDIAVSATGVLAETGGISLPRDAVFIWSPSADGNVKPTRIITGAATKLRGPSSVAFGAGGNIFVTTAGDPHSGGLSIHVYRANANGNAAPVRSIHGLDTLIDEPRGIAVDPDRSRILVSGGRSGNARILVFPIDARGNVKPAADITGPKTGLAAPRGIAVDSAGFIYVGNGTGVNGRNGWITVYKPNSNGDAAPVQTIKGSHVDVLGYITVR